MKATDFLEKGAEILGTRGKDYDTEGGERSMGKTVNAFNEITGQNLTEAEGWLLMQILKDVRQWSNPTYHADSAEDCVNYAALKAEALSSVDELKATSLGPKPNVAIGVSWGEKHKKTISAIKPEPDETPVAHKTMNQVREENEMDIIAGLNPGVKSLAQIILENPFGPEAKSLKAAKEAIKGHKLRGVVKDYWDSK